MGENKFGTAVILAGGKSSRMGFNKEFLEIDGESLVKKNIEKLKTIFNEIIVVTNNPEYYESLNIITVQDIYFQKGPLSGIHASLKRSSSEYIYLLACDMPEIDIPFIKWMMDIVKREAPEISVVRRDGRIEPFNGFYSVALADRVEELLKHDKLAIRALMSEAKVEFIDLHEVQSGRDIFLNLNTQEDLHGYLEQRRDTVMKVVSKRDVLKIRYDDSAVEEDSIITEYPFTVFLNGKEFLTLLCTKQSLDYLLVGFLISEGLIDGKQDIEKLEIDEEKGTGYVETVKKSNLMEKLYGKRTLTSGCGKGTVFYSVVDSFKSKKVDQDFKLDVDSMKDLMRKFNRYSETFLETGGVHSCALSDGEDIAVFADDIGRHNALDKIIGEAVMKDIEFDDKVVVTTGRISSEIMIKIAKRGIPAIVSKSAPTQLAIEIAEDLGITVVGFARGQKMNIYTNIDRYIQL
ncbi:putative molybdenum cofactor guanylyltransferase [Andreesenia angusta]|uniref:Multifunctional fusion protein n=1 Tax=Andreesenia angusta TaxID=39480 RepID=A0A1S1V3W2_9FIRM|nr:formate dehydrogenase accessory sulfurtransferase FdhD [Andreesenia angusta]OHW61343.1 putative molybdenum cofactor guanylyltransferase [Andreesenia angusta]